MEQKKEALVSIATHGMKKPGEVVDGRKITVLPGHIDEKETVNGIKNWARSIFTSPSIFYSCNPIYSKEVIDKNK